MIFICDTGPLVAFLSHRDTHHVWATGLWKQLRRPLLTCDAVITEAAYFLREDGLTVEPLFQMLERGAIKLEFHLASHWPRVRTLMARYTQMDLADACIVAMTEQHRACQVLTVDRSDFSTYRRNDRQVIDFVAPPRH